MRETRMVTIKSFMVARNQGDLRSFACFTMRSSSAHEGKIIFFERFHCSYTVKLRIGKINWKV